MPSSGSVDFTVSRDDIIKDALRGLGALGRGGVPSADDISEMSIKLQMIVKQWQGNNDFAPGLKTWTRKRGYIFPELNGREYTLGPNGDHATSSYSSTTLSAAEAAGQTVLSVTATTGMSADMYIGIRCTDGSIHWSTIDSTGVGTVTIDDALTVNAASGAKVYFYTTKLLMPLSVISLRRKSTSNSEIQLSVMTLNDYESIPDKTVNGTPVRYLYEPGITDGTLFLDVGISDTTDVYPITFLRKIEDFDATADTPDYPQVWYLPLSLQLQILAAPMKGKEEKIPSLRTMLYGDGTDRDPGALRIAQTAEAENVDPSIYFRSEE